MFDIKKPGVYRFVFEQTGGQIYIGAAWQKKGIEGRWRDHERGRGNSPDYLIRLAELCGGWTEVKKEILKNTYDGNDKQKRKIRALLWEQAFVNKYKNNNLLLNKNLNVLSLIPPSLFGENHWMFGRGYLIMGENNPMFKLKNREKHLKAVQSQEYRDVMSRLKTGENNPMSRLENRKKHLEVVQSQEYRDMMSRLKSGENNSNFGRVWTEEQRRANFEYWTLERRKEASKSISKEKNWMFGMIGEKHPRSKLFDVQREEICVLYASGDWTQEDLGRKFNVGRGVIKYVLKHWKSKNA